VGVPGAMATSNEAAGALSKATDRQLRKSKSMPGRLLDSTNAFKASVDMPPKFTMRKKLEDPANKEKRPGCQTYDIGKMARNGKMTMPEWSMAPRSSGIPPVPDFPGPGHYPIPGSIYGSHPCITQPGRVARQNVQRPDPQDWEPRETPSPQEYAKIEPGTFGRVDQSKAPKWTIRQKLVDPANKEKKPGCQTYDIKNCNRNGPMTAPEWSMMARSSGIPPDPGFPGPGEYVQPGTIYGQHPTIHQPARVPKTTQKRSEPSEWEPKDTPSPQDYNLVKPGEFGHAGHEKAPKFTMRKKIVDPASKEKKPGCQTYDIGKCARHGPMTAPQWTMAPRSSGIPPTPGFPGPGHYPLPGSIYGSHPCIEQPGRVARQNVQRPDPQEWEPKCTPSPQAYQKSEGGTFGRVDQSKAPKYSIRQKLTDPANKEKRPGCQTYDIGKQSRKGTMKAPSWSMASRGSGIPKTPGFPGPGEYVLPGSIYGSHPAIEQPGRVPKTTAARFDKELEERPY